MWGCDDFEQTCVCMWKMVYAVGDSDLFKGQLLKGGVSSTAVCGKWPPKLRDGTRGGTFDSRKDEKLTGQSPSARPARRISA